MKDNTLIMSVSDKLLDLARDYAETHDDWTNSDFQGFCMAQAMDIIKMVREG